MEKNRYFLSGSNTLLSIIHKEKLYSIFIDRPDDVLNLQAGYFHKSWSFKVNKEIPKKLAWLLCPHAFYE